MRRVECLAALQRTCNLLASATLIPIHHHSCQGAAACCISYYLFYHMLISIFINFYHCQDCLKYLQCSFYCRTNLVLTLLILFSSVIIYSIYTVYIPYLLCLFIFIYQYNLFNIFLLFF